MTVYQTTKIRPLNIAFVLDPDSLRKLAKILGKASPRLQFTVTLAGGVTTRYPTIEDVIEHHNLTTNPIIALIAGTPTEDAQSCYIVFRAKPEPTVEYTINGPEEKVESIAPKLDEWIQVVRQGYSLLYRPAVAWVVFGVAFYSPILLWDRVVTHFLTNVPPTGSPAKASFIFGLWGVCILLASALFPKATFAIGQGANRHQRMNKIRAALSYTVPLAIIGSLIAAWLHDHYHR